MRTSAPKWVTKKGEEMKGNYTQLKKQIQKSLNNQQAEKKDTKS